MFLAGVLLLGGTGSGAFGNSYILEEISLDQGIVNVDINFEVTVATIQQVSVEVSTVEILPIEVADFEVL